MQDHFFLNAWKWPTCFSIILQINSKFWKHNHLNLSTKLQKATALTAYAFSLVELRKIGHPAIACPKQRRCQFSLCYGALAWWPWKQIIYESKKFWNPITGHDVSNNRHLPLINVPQNFAPCSKNLPFNTVTGCKDCVHNSIDNKLPNVPDSYLC